MFTKKLMDVGVSEDMNNLEKVFLDSGIPQLSDRQILFGFQIGVFVLWVPSQDFLKWMHPKLIQINRNGETNSFGMCCFPFNLNNAPIGVIKLGARFNQQ
jgi:hypothetical protein